MELLIIRHAKAESNHSAGDRARALTPHGMEQARKLGVMLLKTGLNPELVLTSPYVRAHQTADHLCRAAGIPGPVVQGWLGCGMDPEDAMKELSAFHDFERVAIVGHEPDLSSFIEWVLGCSGASVEVKKASITGMMVHPPAWHGRLLFHIPPVFH
jgi:phosphohistidine phosphatase